MLVESHEGGGVGTLEGEVCVILGGFWVGFSGTGRTVMRYFGETEGYLNAFADKPWGGGDVVVCRPVSPT